MDELYYRLWYGAHNMFTFPTCLCAKRGSPSLPRCLMSSEEIGVKVLSYLREVVRRSIMLALVTSTPVAYSPVEAEYIQPPANHQPWQGAHVPHGPQASDHNPNPNDSQAPSAHRAPSHSRLTTGTQSLDTNQAPNGNPAPKISKGREESTASGGSQAPEGDQTLSIRQASDMDQASDSDPASNSSQSASDRQAPTPERRTFFRWFRRSTGTQD